MIKNLTAAICFVAASFSATAQTLFTYGNDTVTVPQFLQAYHKNNTGTQSAKAMQDYLDLYVASRLKIKEAKALRYDTLPQLTSDLQNLREQIMGPYLTDDAAEKKLVDEAFTRSQKDIHIAHIFISFADKNGMYDTTKARQRAEEVYAQLRKGTAFATVAKEFSADPSVAKNGGDLGYITVFTLPYALENLAYTTPVGKLSPIYESRSGFHIFKNLGERKAAGRMKAAEILLAFPPTADAAAKEAIRKRADSLYNRLQKGDDFSELASKFSNDMVSGAARGSMPEFGVGEYDPTFENIVFTQLKDGQISKPFLTSHGYHIVKRIGRVPVPAAATDEVRKTLKEKIETNDRINTANDALAAQVLKNINFRKQPFREAELWALSDSVLDYKVPSMPITLKQDSPLFYMDNQPVTVNNWIMYAQAFRYKSDGSGIKPYTQVWDDFVKATALDYYRAHLEKFNPAFREQLAEFNDGNLFFEIMQQKVWTPAQSDTTALLAYYQQHRSRYQWGKSAEAVVFYANDADAATKLLSEIKKAPANWRDLVAATNEKVAADSGRFELAQLPNGNKAVLKKGLVTEPVVNKTDHTTSFAYIINLYDAPAQRSFAEARGLVINDYQAELEKAWVAELKKKYPVVMNEKAIASLMSK